MNRLTFSTLTFIGLVSLVIACKSTQPITQVDMSSSDEVINISYEGTIKQIISDNCTTCHSGDRPTAGLDLSKYDDLVEAVKIRHLIDRINDPRDPMPPADLMSKQDRLLIQKWANNDFKLRSSHTEIRTNEYTSDQNFVAPDLQAINIDETGFEFMEKMQGHWVGKMFLLGKDLPWFTFDFRAINSSQLHGLFEGGTMGNLFNTFFVAEYKGIKTIMLRNGGILNGIYRTSYFVLTEVKNDEYLFEDAYGGKQIMWVKISFKDDRMKMLTYTSKLGMNKPSRHIEFEGKRLHTDLAQQSARKFNFPTKEIFKHFPNGMPLPQWGKEYPTITSASYIMQADTKDYITLGKDAKDPIQITDLKNIASVKLQFSRTDLSKAQNISIYLSRAPLTNGETFKTDHGFITEEAMNEVILFPEIDARDHEFTLTYLHTGKCYITFVVDNDKDLIPSKGDYYSISKVLHLTSDSLLTLKVDNINKVIQY